MGYKTKSLIIFDTNSLRKVRINSKEREIIDYSNFNFGSPFHKIKSYIEEKKIENVISLAIPEMVLLELQNQCEKQYQKEFKIIKEALNRIGEIPSKNGITLTDPDEEFIYRDYINEKIENVLGEHNIIKIPFDETKTLVIFKNMLEKVLDLDDVKSPFRPKDAGFKDNVIWESLIRFDDIGKYDKIFFLTKDGDYKDNCYEEFKTLWPKQDILIRKDPGQIIVDIERIYQDYLAEKEIFDFTESQFFKETLDKTLSTKQKIDIGGVEYPIVSFSIDNYAIKIEKQLPDENEVENIVVISDIEIEYFSGSENIQIKIIGNTLLYDEPSKEILETTFEPELI